MHLAVMFVQVSRPYAWPSGLVRRLLHPVRRRLSTAMFAALLGPLVVLENSFSTRPGGERAEPTTSRTMDWIAMMPGHVAATEFYMLGSLIFP